MGRRRETRAQAVPAAELRERLRQAEETLRAIRQGEVDAFVVARGRSARVLALQGTEHPYIALVERINEGAVTLSRDGVILYCNGCFARFLRLPREQILESPFREAVAPDDREAFDAMFTRGTEGGSRSEITLLSADGTRHEVLLSLSPLAPGLEPGQVPEQALAGVIGIVTDLDDLKGAERVLEARVLQQAAVAELGQRALAGVSLDALLQEATRLVARTLETEHCGVAELLPGGEQMQVRAVTGALGPPDGFMLADGDSMWWLALRSEEPVLVEDITTDPRFSGRSLPARNDIVSAVAVVVPGDGVPFGVLGATSIGRHKFSGDDAHFLQAVANVLAAAIIRRRSEDLHRWLLEELTKSRDGERRRLSRELHDETTQSLWALVVGLDALETVAELEHARDAAHRLHAIAARTLDDIGRLARGLHPGALDDHGLVAAATQYLHDFTASYGIPVEQGVENLEQGRLPPEVEITLYRILQEALTNVARHARARSVRVTLRRRAAAVELTVADDGIGFRVEPVRSPVRPGGLGLHGMRERASMLGGEVTVASQPGGGATVTARIPLQAAADQ